MDESSRNYFPTFVLPALTKRFRCSLVSKIEIKKIGRRNRLRGLFVLPALTMKSFFLKNGSSNVFDYINSRYLWISFFITVEWNRKKKLNIEQSAIRNKINIYAVIFILLVSGWAWWDETSDLETIFFDIIIYYIYITSMAEIKFHYHFVISKFLEDDNYVLPTLLIRFPP
jgi:hypothetical protein